MITHVSVVKGVVSYLLKGRGQGCGHIMVMGVVKHVVIGRGHMFGHGCGQRAWSRVG